MNLVVMAEALDAVFDSFGGDEPHVQYALRDSLLAETMKRCAPVLKDRVSNLTVQRDPNLYPKFIQSLNEICI